MIWKGLMFITKSESPVVVVLSGSMEPAFQRGIDFIIIIIIIIITTKITNR